MYFRCFGAPSGHFPGSSVSRSLLPGHPKVISTVTRTSWLVSVGHLPGASWMNAVFVAQLHYETSRTGTSFIPHFGLGHTPGLSSRTFSSPGIVHTYDSGSSAGAAGGFDAGVCTDFGAAARCAPAVIPASATATTRTAGLITAFMLYLRAMERRS